jgi:hypothetical protein
LETSLAETLGKSDLLKLSTDLDDIALHSLVESGLLHDIPVVGLVAKMTSVGLSVRDFLFMRKLSKILSCLDEIPVEERKRWLENLEKDPKFRGRVMADVILLMDRLNDLHKATSFGKIFAAYVSSKINYEDFRRLASALDQLQLMDLPVLQKWYGNQGDTQKLIESNYDSLQNLAICGLVRISQRMDLRDSDDLKFERNPLGEQFVTLALS